MNKYIFILGVLSSLIWGSIALISFGLSVDVCLFIDNVTFHLFTEQVFEMSHGFYYDVSNNDMPTWVFIILFFVNFFIMLCAAQFIERNNEKTNTKWTLIGIVFFAVVFRLTLLPSVLIHENDIYRYLWDGKSLNHAINPYKYAPADVFMYEQNASDDYYDEFNEVTVAHRNFNEQDAKRLNKLIALRDENTTLYNRIGHWQVSTIYPPVAQWIFSLSTAIKKDSLIFMKFIFLLFDIGNIILIIFLLNHFGRNPAMSLIYAWSPLVLKEYANSGHYDPIAIFFTLLTLFLYFKRKSFQGVFVLALATLSKFFSGILLPILYKPKNIFAYIVFVLVCVLFYIPFVYLNDCGFNQVFLGLHTYNEEWSYNSSIFAIVYRLFDNFVPTWSESYFPAKITVGVIYLGLIGKLLLKKDKTEISILYKSFIAIAGLFILNPVGDPWYFCWSIPFLCFFPFRSWILLSGLLIFSYLNFHDDIWLVHHQWWGVPLTSWLIYCPFFVYLTIELWKKPEYLTTKDC